MSWYKNWLETFSEPVEEPQERELEVSTIHPGDTAIVSFPGRITRKEFERIKQSMADHEFLIVLEGGIKVSRVHKQGEQDD